MGRRRWEQWHSGQRKLRVIQSRETTGSVTHLLLGEIGGTDVSFFTMELSFDGYKKETWWWLTLLVGKQWNNMLFSLGLRTGFKYPGTSVVSFFTSWRYKLTGGLFFLSSCRYVLLCKYRVQRTEIETCVPSLTPCEFIYGHHVCNYSVNLKQGSGLFFLCDIWN